MKIEYLFLDGKPFSGISKKSGNPFTMHKIKLHDPLTIENHQLDYDPRLEGTLAAYNRGDRVNIETKLVAPSFGNGDSRAVVVGITPVK